MAFFGPASDSTQITLDAKYGIYPAAKPMGVLSDYFFVLAGECADKAGDVWITDIYAQTITEYAHGGSSPIASLSDPGNPNDCSVDPRTGDLAVINTPSEAGPGDVAIYRQATGVPTLFQDVFIKDPAYCGYDAKGDLFIDGVNASGALLGELRRGTFTNFTFSQNIGEPAGVLWDGTHVAILDSSANTIYQLALDGSVATVVGSTPLDDSNDAEQFWIAGGNVIAGDHRAAYFWPYPAGGYPIKAIVGLGSVVGSVISKVPSSR